VLLLPARTAPVPSRTPRPLLLAPAAAAAVPHCCPAGSFSPEDEEALNETLGELLLVLEQLDERIGPMLEQDGSHFNKRCVASVFIRSSDPVVQHPRSLVPPSQCSCCGVVVLGGFLTHACVSHPCTYHGVIGQVKG
jgi:hypothetical protein